MQVAVNQDDYVIRTIQEPLGHKNVSTTMVYAHVPNKGGHGVRSRVYGLQGGLYSLYKPGVIDIGRGANCLIGKLLHKNVRRARDFLYGRSQSVFSLLYGPYNHCWPKKNE